VYSVDGLLLISEFNDFFGTDISTEEYDTIGGWVYSQMEIPPRKNDKILYENVEFIIEETDNLRIARLLVHKVITGNEEQVEEIGA
jgi:Mg2+/Co2+ transporter CorC